MDAEALVSNFLGFSSCITSTKLDEVKTALSRLPSAYRLQYSESSTSLHDALLTFWRLEKAYLSLAFINLKSLFFKKEDHSATYRHLYVGFQNIQTDDPVYSETFEAVIRIADHLKSICVIRSRLIEFYRSIELEPLPLSTRCQSLRDSLCNLVSLLEQPEDCANAALGPIYTLIRLELHILIDLFSSQHNLGIMCGEALFHLNNASKGLTSLGRKLQNQRSTCGGVASAKSCPPLFAWLSRFHGILLAKYTLYCFSAVSSAAPSPARLEELLATEQPNLVARMIQLQQRVKAQFASLFFDGTGLRHRFCAHSYAVQETDTAETVKGMSSIPVVFTAPLDQRPPVADASVIVMRISRDLSPVVEKEESCRTIYLYDEKLDRTYLIHRLEERIFLACVFQGCRPRRDNELVDSIASLTDVIQLRAVKSSLRTR